MEKERRRQCVCPEATAKLKMASLCCSFQARQVALEGAAQEVCQQTPRKTGNRAATHHCWATRQLEDGGAKHSVSLFGCILACVRRATIDVMLVQINSSLHALSSVRKLMALSPQVECCCEHTLTHLCFMQLLDGSQCRFQLIVLDERAPLGRQMAAAARYATAAAAALVPTLQQVQHRQPQLALTFKAASSCKRH